MKFGRRRRSRYVLVGDVTLAYESLQLPADPGLTLVTYSAEPGSSTEEALRELAHWAGTRRRLTAVGAEMHAASTVTSSDVRGK
jgi:transcription regulator MmyB-like protein